MRTRYSVKLKTIVEEHKLRILHTSKDYESATLSTSDVNRPAMQLTGFYNYFDPSRMQIIGRVEMIESVDTVRLLNIIDRESLRAGVVTKVLLQLHVAREETKFGFSVEELMDFFENRGFESLKATHICGLMGMASNRDDMERVSSDFREISRCYNLIRNDGRLRLRGFDILSMGMTNDYKVAIDEGSNHVRIGTALFGEREY